MKVSLRTSRTILRDESRSHRLQFAAYDSDANSSARAYLPIAGVASGLGDAEGPVERRRGRAVLRPVKR